MDFERSLSFVSGYPKMARFMDKKYGFNSFSRVMGDLSKYSYPILAVHRDKGVRGFLGYVRELNKLGYGVTVYYYIYVAAPLVFGKGFCDYCIILIKKALGKTPRL